MKSVVLLVAAFLCAVIGLCHGAQTDCSEEAVNTMFSECDADKWDGQKIARDLNPSDLDRMCRAQSFVLHCHERVFSTCPDSPVVTFIQAWMPSMEDMWSDFHFACPGIE